MLIETEETKKLNQQIEKSERNYEKDERKRQKAVNLSAELREMTRRSNSVERSQSQNRIGIFNRNFTDKFTELSRLRQTTGNMDRDEAVETIRQWKKEK